MGYSYEDFITVYEKNIKRKGSLELLEWLKNSDFFQAPASAKYHMNEPGGLLIHSLNVYYRLKRFMEAEYPDGECPYTRESIALVSLLHDVCKTNTYRLSWRNQKTYDEEKVRKADSFQVKHDNGGNFIWESVSCYEYDEDIIMGHGEKSVYLIMTYMDLTISEAQAIRYHMSAYRSEDTKVINKVYSQNPLAFYLHVADEAATFIDEV